MPACTLLLIAIDENLHQQIIKYIPDYYSVSREEPVNNINISVSKSCFIVADFENLSPDEKNLILDLSLKIPKKVVTIHHKVDEPLFESLRNSGVKLAISHDQLYLLQAYLEIAAEEHGQETISAAPLYEKSLLPLARIQTNGELMYGNKAFKALLGIPEDSLTQKYKLQDFFYNYAHYLEFIQTATTSLGQTPYAARLHNKQNETIPCRLNAMPIFSPHRNITGFDILVERKKEQTNENEKLLNTYQLAIENSPASIVITDCRGNIEYVNPKFSQVTGYTPREVIGRNPRILKSGDLGRDYYREMWETLLAGQDWRGEFCNRKKNGERYWEHASISPLKNESGEIYRFIAVKEDITLRKKAEIEMQIMRNHEQEANRLKTALLTNVSHEIRTPMNAILGFANLLRLYADNETKRNEYVELINSNSRKLIDLLDNITDLSRLESGFSKISIDRFNLTELILDTYLLYARNYTNELTTGISFAYHIPWGSEEEYSIESDKFALSKILNILLTHAFDHTKSGEIEFGAQKHSPSELLFYVKDTGKGIEKSKLRKLFKSFLYDDEGATGQISYTYGLQLSIVNKTIEFLGGRFWIDSDIQKGTKTYFTLPVSEVKKSSANLVNGQHTATPPYFKGEIILYEPDPAGFQFLKEALKKFCHTITGVNDLDFIPNGEVSKKRIIIINTDKAPVKSLTLLKKMAGNKNDLLVGIADDHNRIDINKYLHYLLIKPIEVNKLYSFLKNFVGEQGLNETQVQ